MSLSRLLALILALGLLSLGLPACGGGDDDDDAADDDDASSDDDDDDDDADDDDTSPPTYSISGQVTDEAGAGLEGVAVTACSAATCLLANSDATGALTIANLPGNDAYVIHNISYPGGNDDAALIFSSFYDIIPLAEEDVQLSGALVVPEVSDSAVPASDASGSVTLGDVTVSWTDPLNWPASTSGIDTLSIGVTTVPEANWPLALGDATGLAAWSFAPFETTLEGEDDDLPDFTVTVLLDGVSVSDSISFLYAHYSEDIETEQLNSSPATLEDVDGVIYATVDVPVLSLLIAVQ